MKNILSWMLMFAVALPIVGCDNGGGSQTSATEKSMVEDSALTDNQKLSRTFGHLLSRQLSRTEDFSLDLVEVIKGMQSEIDGQSAPLTDTEYEKQMAEVQKASFEAKCSENLASAEKFLKENKEKAGVIELEPNKLQYRVVKEGTGRVLSGKPTALLHYTGSFIDGKVFDSSEKNKEPILLPLTKVIPGFSQGMQGMKEGEVRVLYIHPDLAYGTAGQLPPNSLLIFEVKLIEANDDNVSVTE
ncbi:FKBP-type peptidyl-prolyl cis-trans isomerase [Chlamydia trachomatis]|uniref:Peptidyl-prolyl cis-trans isomerase Mip n=3 Tax=Chlamydia trachomatis TaxID=813 RepID=MIP_CHLTR|nr:FKBP-type peptidyl-prolyl cis-trans isomerase [Chlamydia trachomatis]NP_220056.1 peptidyl-prolyl cis-trans isomerase [Chlamydia trachomatis D/UW-3/CX]P26623.3 RecName: Full=Peptidyl-prolyl cis-trans isomerase Mip; Short=PPIase; AltName: Full=27 kDa membrane protein; AltName: Full=Chl-Mip; AltName: Full=Rotamase; Flags: Precursor [Chlamydia trachomatis D/UW-3/CX]AAC68143.1 FKBP-type peptidyl-prolyl cis-trans isomerase [Chlamydia trachomatis D/UW-3/CX]AAX50816.1 peptidyl-prolyl cis-trans isome